MARRTYLRIVAAVVILGSLLLVALILARVPTDDATLVVVRVSGTPGTSYSGEYGTANEEVQRVNGALRAEPTDYEVNAEGGFLDTGLEPVLVVFWKTRPSDEGALKVEILHAGQVVAEDEASKEFGVITIVYPSS